MVGTAIGLAVCLGAIHLAGSPSPPELPAPPRVASMAIVGAAVVDPRGDGSIAPDRALILADGELVRIVAAADFVPSEGMRVIDGRGRFVVPGLWDSHVHTLRLSPQLHLPLLVAHGVTSIRDLGDSCSWAEATECRPDRDRWLAKLRTGAIVGPRIVQTASFHVEGMPEDPADLAGLMRELKARGDEMVKAQLDDAGPANELASLVRAAQTQGLRVSGHLPYKADPLTLPVPLLTIEHDHSLLPQCSAARASFDGRNRSKPALLATGDDARCEALLRVLAERGTAYVPTHVASSGQDLAFAGGRSPMDEDQMRYVIAPQRWLWSLMRAAGRTGPEEYAVLADYHRAALALTLRAQRAGVPVLAGSDALDADVLHGDALHRELETLVKAGLTPAQALAAATIVPATHFGMADRLGTVEAGKQADLLVLSGNPLADIRNTRRIEWVIADGRVYGSKERAAALAYVETQAGRWTTNARFLRGLWSED